MQPAHGLSGPRPHHREEAARPLVEEHRRHHRKVGVLLRRPHRDDRLVDVYHRLDVNGIDTALGKSRYLLGECVISLRLRQRILPQRIVQHLPRRTHRSHHEAPLRRLAPRMRRRHFVELRHPVLVAIVTLAPARAAERICQHHLRTRVEVRLRHPLHDRRVAHVPLLRVAVSKSVHLQVAPGRAVRDDQLATRQFLKYRGCFHVALCPCLPGTTCRQVSSIQ